MAIHTLAADLFEVQVLGMGKHNGPFALDRTGKPSAFGLHPRTWRLVATATATDWIGSSALVMANSSVTADTTRAFELVRSATLRGSHMGAMGKTRVELAAATNGRQQRGDAHRRDTNRRCPPHGCGPQFKFMRTRAMA